MKPVRVLLVDDHKVVRQGLRSVLEPDSRFEVVGEAGSGEDALRLVCEHGPDVVILDLRLPGLGGTEICRRIVEFDSKIVVLILTAFIDRQLVDDCLRAGARGYLLKDAETLHLEEQILAAVHGHAALDPRVAGIITDYLLDHKPPSEDLSPREMEVLRLVAIDMTNSEIGVKLYISENTVKHHVKKLLVKLEARNRVDAVQKAKDRDLL